MVLGALGAAANISVSINAVDNFSKTFQGLQGTLQKNRAGFTALAAGGAIVTGALGLAVKAASDFDAALNESLAIMSNVSDAMRDDMAQAAIEVSKTTTFSAKEAAEAYFFLASAGLDASESIAAMPAVAQFAQAGMFDLARATDILTDAQSALGLTMDDPIANMREMTRVSDVLVKANTIANATVEQFGTSLINQMAPAMRNVNMSIEEGVAILSVWADQGIKGERAGTLFRMTIDQLQDAARDNSDAFEEYGISVFNSSGELRSMADVVADMEVALGDMSVEQRSATMSQLGFSIRSREGILALMGNSEQLRIYEEELKNAGGTADSVANKQLQTLNAQLDLLKSDVMELVMDVGEALIPILIDLVNAVKPVIESVVNWMKENPGLTKTIAVVAGIAGSLALVLGTIGLVLPSVIAGVKLLGVAFTIATGPIGLIVAAIAAAIAIGVLLYKNWDQVSATAKNLWESLKNVFGGIRDVIVNAFKGAFNLVADVWNGFINGWQSSVNLVFSGINGLIQLANKVPGVNLPTFGNVDFSSFNIKKVNDFVITSRGEVLQPHNDDAILGMKDFSGLGGGQTINVYIDRVQGADPDDLADAFARELKNRIGVS